MSDEPVTQSEDDDEGFVEGEELPTSDDDPDVDETI